MREPPDTAWFQARVYLIVGQVPAGRVTTYGQIATMIPAPDELAPLDYERIAAQWVGRAMRQAPEGTPWHRVINSQGKISLPAGSRGGAIQRMRLEAEGIVFDRNGRVDLGRFGWHGPDSTWIKENNLLPARPLSHSGPTQLSLFSGEPAIRDR